MEESYLFSTVTYKLRENSAGGSDHIYYVFYRAWRCVEWLLCTPKCNTYISVKRWSERTKADQGWVSWLIFSQVALLVENSSGCDAFLHLQGANSPSSSSKGSCHWGKHCTQNIPSPVYLTTAFAKALKSTCGLQTIPPPSCAYMVTECLAWFLGREIWTTAHGRLSYFPPGVSITFHRGGQQAISYKFTALPLSINVPWTIKGMPLDKPCNNQWYATNVLICQIKTNGLWLK